MAVDRAQIDEWKSKGLGVVRVFGLDEYHTLIYGFAFCSLFALFVIIYSFNLPDRVSRPRAAVKSKKDE